MRARISRSLLVLTTACLIAIGCASRGAVPKPFPGATSPPAVDPSRAAPTAVIATALSYRGAPYRNGGSDPAGFDCSGFVQWVFAQHGVRLPREVRDQYDAGRKIRRDDIKPGDLVFFNTSGGASHVGIALGGDQFVHAPSSRGVVRVETYTSDYWSKRYVGTRRVELGSQE